MAEQNIALDSSSQTVFTKAVKNIQRLLKKKSLKAKARAPGVPATGKVKVKKDWRYGHVVALKHIPHGFYENEILDYFSQFGTVTGVRLNRSSKTGMSQSHGMVMFKDEYVAKIAAETMNNYLMFDKLFKAEYLPNHMGRTLSLDEVPVTPETCKTARRRKRYIEAKNSRNTKNELADTPAMRRRLVKTVERAQRKLKAIGIEYNFKVSDAPEESVAEQSDAEQSDAIESDDGDCQPPELLLDMSDPDIEFSVPPGMFVRLMERSKKLATPKRVGNSIKKGASATPMSAKGKTTVRNSIGKVATTPRSANGKTTVRNSIGKVDSATPRSVKVITMARNSIGKEDATTPRSANGKTTARNSIGKVDAATPRSAEGKTTARKSIGKVDAATPRSAKVKTTARNSIGKVDVVTPRSVKVKTTARKSIGKVDAATPRSVKGKTTARNSIGKVDAATPRSAKGKTTARNSIGKVDVATPRSANGKITARSSIGKVDHATPK